MTERTTRPERSPREIAVEFAAGRLKVEQAIDQLGAWPYRDAGHPDEHDGLWEPGPGTWLDVELAHSDGLITDEVYSGALALSLRGRTKCEPRPR